MFRSILNVIFRLSASLLGWAGDHFEISSLIAIGAVIFAVSSIRRHSQEKKAKEKFQKAQRVGGAEPLTLHPEIDPTLCAGCGACTKVCPEGDILKMIQNKAVLVTPSKCVGHGLCEVACPMGAISLVFGTKTKGMEIPRLSKSYETNVPGLYIAGELGGMGLIRNAVKQGVVAANDAIKKMSPLKDPSPTSFDLLIIGAGPAGLAAALKATELKRKYLVIEQNSFGGTINNFPRQKIVMTRPAELPLAGLMRFPSHHVSKEALLEYWQQLRMRWNLNIKEKCRFEDLKIQAGGRGFEIRTSAGTFTAQKLILALGVRGSPRRLGLQNEDLPKVAYNLTDAQQYQKKTIAVVGAGNAGVEAAIDLSKTALGNTVHLFVRGAHLDRCNDENQQRLQKRIELGRVKVWYESVVSEIHERELLILKQNEPVRIPNDALFVFAGAEVPFKFLGTLGVVIDKKFGEGLKEAA